MIMSVSILIIGSGAATPVNVVNLSMAVPRARRGFMTQAGGVVKRAAQPTLRSAAGPARKSKESTDENAEEAACRGEDGADHEGDGELERKEIVRRRVGRGVDDNARDVRNHHRAREDSDDRG